MEKTLTDFIGWEIEFFTDDYLLIWQQTDNLNWHFIALKFMSSGLNWGNTKYKQVFKGFVSHDGIRHMWFGDKSRYLFLPDFGCLNKMFLRLEEIQLQIMNLDSKEQNKG